MMFITYKRDPIKVRARGELPEGGMSTTFNCTDDAEVHFKDGVLTVKGGDVHLQVFAISSVTVTITK